jgi:hypothetical protein
MGRYQFPAFNQATTPRYLVVWDLQWQIIDCRCLEASSDLSAAMSTAIERLADQGWKAEGSIEYGFVFMRRAAERRLLMLTRRDPFTTTAQSFSPFCR